MMNRINSIFRRNLPAKILALFVAIILWVVVMNDQNPSIEGSFTVPVAVVNAPEGYKITKSDEDVKIKVRGPRSLFVSASAEDFRAYVDPLDQLVQKGMRADVTVTGSSAAGTTVAKVSQDASFVTLEGPQSAIDTVVRVVGYVGLAGNNTDFDVTVPLTALNADGREVQGVRVVPQTTSVSVQLARGLSKKIVSIHPVLADDLADGYQLGDVRTDPIKIEIAGDAKTIESLTAVDTETIDLAKFTSNQKITVKLTLPSGVTVTNPDVVVSIEIKKKK